jgi:hypothetical protein
MDQHANIYEHYVQKKWPDINIRGRHGYEIESRKTFDYPIRTIGGGAPGTEQVHHEVILSNGDTIHQIEIIVEQPRHEFYLDTIFTLGYPDWAKTDEQKRVYRTTWKVLLSQIDGFRDKRPTAPIVSPLEFISRVSIDIGKYCIDQVDMEFMKMVDQTRIGLGGARCDDRLVGEPVAAERDGKPVWQTVIRPPFWFNRYDDSPIPVLKLRVPYIRMRISCIVPEPPRIGKRQKNTFFNDYKFLRKSSCITRIQYGFISDDPCVVPSVEVPVLGVCSKRQAFFGLSSPYYNTTFTSNQKSDYHTWNIDPSGPTCAAQLVFKHMVKSFVFCLKDTETGGYVDTFETATVLFNNSVFFMGSAMECRTVFPATMGLQEGPIAYFIIPFAKDLVNDYPLSKPVNLSRIDNCILRVKFSEGQKEAEVDLVVWAIHYNILINQGGIVSLKYA